MNFKYFLDDYKVNKSLLEDFLSKDILKEISDMLDRDENPSSEGCPELFQWMNVLLGDKKFTDEVLPEGMNYIDWKGNPDYKDSDDWSGKLIVKLSPLSNVFLEFTLWVGCGSFIGVHKSTDSFKEGEYVTYRDLVVLAQFRIEQYDRHIADLEKKQAKQDDLEKKLRAVEAANSLMDVFGLKLDKESQKKVEQWQKELEDVR